MLFLISKYVKKYYFNVKYVVKKQFYVCNQSISVELFEISFKINNILTYDIT